MRLALLCLLSIPAIFVVEHFSGPVHATGGSSGGLSVFFGYAEDKETNNPPPGAFPVPWSGAPNTIFLGGPVVGQTACGALPLCYDAGAIRLDNNGSSDVTIDKVSVDIHSSIPGGKVFSLWGSFTVPAGKSVILTENPPNNNPNYDNFDTSGYPKGNCTPLSVEPTATFTIGGVPTTVVDSTHILDTHGIDLGSCKPKQNESIPWAQAGTLGVNASTVTLSPATASQVVGQQVTETATALDGSGNGLANTPVSFSVTGGPDAGQSGTVATDSTGHASFSYTGTAPGTD
ncbi:MAG: Ig-like domain-containing protein, partial [Ktedonobacteraceae bacterium]|nr:Ig-like domain-containing protein [Ktedonobacteraceae bacterium]